MVDQNDAGQIAAPAFAMAEVRPMIGADQARVNVTWQGQNADLPDPVAFDSTDGDVKGWVTEAIRHGIPGLRADAGVDLRDFVVDRFTSTETRPYNLIQIRPKTPFGGREELLPSKITVNDIARICHEALRAYNKAIGDPDDDPWETAPAKLKESRVKGVENVLDNANYSPKDQHEAWREGKVADGWKYGVVKDRERKMHHCLLPWSDLPVHQKKKGDLFVGIIRSLQVRS